MSYYGILGTVDLTIADTETEIYAIEAPATYAVADINICNRSTSEVRVKLAHKDITTSDTVYIEDDIEIPAYGNLLRTATMISAGTVLVAQANSTNVNIVVYGVQNGEGGLAEIAAPGP